MAFNCTHFKYFAIYLSLLLWCFIIVLSPSLFNIESCFYVLLIGIEVVFSAVLLFYAFIRTHKG